jgi:hypothetical protein
MITIADVKKYVNKDDEITIIPDTVDTICKYAFSNACKKEDYEMIKLILELYNSTYGILDYNVRDKYI